MASIPRQFQIRMDGTAAPTAMVECGGSARFTMLTPRMIRMEYSTEGSFEDRPSTAFLHRHQPVPSYQVKQTENGCEINTAYLRLSYQKTPAGFTPETLSVTQKKNGMVWKYGDADRFNLGGTTRTVDGVEGATTLGSGLMSRDGWSVFDDSASQVFNNECWMVRRTVTPGKQPEKDLYFFGYGTDYQACLADFCKVSGNHPMIPKWILGNWWSRYWNYTQVELKGLIEEFKNNGIPLSVCIIDMDWHLPGWTGYTWDPKYFPDVEGFMKWLHAQGVRTALNLHPADGVQPHEKAYPAMAKAMGVDPKSKNAVPFDIENPKFAKAYFELLHHPLEKQGIDFWWMDWQQANVNGVDPLFMLNHLHYLDLGRTGKHRSFVFSRWGGLGNHRYPIGFSGDSHVTWGALAFQPYFTATAANVGYHLWSHDIGGHFQGTEDPELFTRWIQFGCFSPILRIHSSKNRYADRRPWAQEESSFKIIRRFMQLRQSLVPYLYTLTRRSAVESVTPIRPMYFEHPQQDAAYAAQNQYLFGPDLIVAPYGTPKDPHTQLSRQAVWLPRGDWHDFFTGRYYKGGRFTTAYGKADHMPVFAKAGAIVPLGPGESWGNQGNPAEYTVRVFAGADGSFELYEDDGVSDAYRSGAFAVTTFKQKFSGKSLAFTISKAQGDLSVLPAKRTWTVSFTGVADPAKVRVTVAGKTVKYVGEYDMQSETYTIVIKDVSVKETVAVTLGGGGVSIRASRTQRPDISMLSRRDRMPQVIADMICGFRIPTNSKHVLDETMEEMKKNSKAIDDLAGLVPDSVIRALVETLFDAGIEYFNVPAEKERRFLAMWNNSRSPRMRFHFKSEWGSFTKKGVIPRELIVSSNRRPGGSNPATWPGENWACTVNYAGIASAVIRK